MLVIHSSSQVTASAEKICRNRMGLNTEHDRDHVPQKGPLGFKLNRKGIQGRAELSHQPKGQSLRNACSQTPLTQVGVLFMVPPVSHCPCSPASACTAACPYHTASQQWPVWDFSNEQAKKSLHVLKSCTFRLLFGA